MDYYGISRGWLLLGLGKSFFKAVWQYCLHVAMVLFSVILTNLRHV